MFQGCARGVGLVSHLSLAGKCYTCVSNCCCPEQFMLGLTQTLSVQLLPLNKNLTPSSVQILLALARYKPRSFVRRPSPGLDPRGKNLSPNRHKFQTQANKQGPKAELQPPKPPSNADKSRNGAPKQHRSSASYRSRMLNDLFPGRWGPLLGRRPMPE